MSKPREFWIVTLDYKLPFDADNIKILDYEPSVTLPMEKFHVIEKSAYDELRAEVSELNKSLRIHSEATKIHLTNNMKLTLALKCAKDALAEFGSGSNPHPSYGDQALKEIEEILK